MLDTALDNWDPALVDALAANRAFATFIEDVAPEVRDRVAERRVSSAFPAPAISRGAVR
jgi:hypothetical protein